MGENNRKEPDGMPEKSPAEAVAMRKFLFCWIPIVIVVLDRLTKYWAQTILKPKKSIPVIGEYVTFTYLENEGAAWGMLSGKINFFVILTALLIVGILLVIARIPSERRYMPMLISFLCLIGGAFGNLFDRIFQGKVTDFISFDVIQFPVFNVADIFVTCSFILLIILVIFVYREEELSFIPLFGTESKK